jgi:hypothetical protein
MQPAPIYPNSHVFAYGPCTHITRNLTAPGAVMRLDASACCDDSTLRAAARRVADLATPMLHTVHEIFAAYTNVTIEHFTRAQSSGANPSGSPFVAGREGPVDPVACTVATGLGNLSCVCGSSIAADCTCPTLAYMQGAKMCLRPGDKLSGIRRVRDPPLLVAAANLARQLGLISDLGVESNIQVWRLMLYGIGGNKLDKDSELRDVTPDELAALTSASEESGQCRFHTRTGGPKTQRSAH